MYISVIVPSYSPQGYLWECLESLYNQTFPKTEYEVVLVLNGCNQPYYSQIYSWLSKHHDLQVNFIQTDEGGVSNARNIGLDNARGEYIAFIDDDDFISPDYLAQLYQHTSPDTIPVCRPLSFNDGTSHYHAYNITKDFDRYCKLVKVPFYKPKRFFNGPVYKLIHKDIIGNRRFDIRFKNGEDSLFMFLISDKIKYVEFAEPTAIYYRRIRENSATKKQNRGYTFKNYSHLILVHTSIYFKHFGKYNTIFYFYSIVGRIKSIIMD